MKSLTLGADVAGRTTFRVPLPHVYTPVSFFLVFLYRGRAQVHEQTHHLLVGTGSVRRLLDSCRDVCIMLGLH